MDKELFECVKKALHDDLMQNPRTWNIDQAAKAAIEAVKSYKYPENEKPYVFATHADEALESIDQENQMKISNCPKCHNFKEHGHVCPIKASTHTP